MNFADKTAMVEGNADSASLVSAVETAGFGAEVIPSDSERQFSIPSIHCASCVSKIESALLKVPGVESASVNLADKTCSVQGQPEAGAILQALENAGYPGTELTPESDIQEKQEQEDKKQYHHLLKHTAIALGLGIPLMIWGVVTGEMSVNTPFQQIAWGGVGLATLLILVFSGKHYFTGMWKALKHGNTNMDTLIAIGTGIAWLYSMVVVLFPHLLPFAARHVYFEASAMIIGLINLGHALELRAKGKTSKAIKRLLGLQVKTARVVRDGQEIDIPTHQVLKGDIVRVRPGEKIAVDGVVTEGSSLVDESMLTGEPLAVKKMPEEEVSAGTLNKNGSLLFRAEKVGSETALAHIIALVKKAQSSKMPIARMADQISSVFVPVVLVIAILAASIWFFFGPAPALAHALVVATTVLIIACPCALGLATPMSVMAGVGKAAELGMLIRKGDSLQQASKLTTIVLDKTGTITEGVPKVTELISTTADTEEERNRILQIAASIESASEHPLADAIVDSAKQQSLSLSPVSDFHAVTGQGVTGSVAEKSVMLGNEKLMAASNIDVSSLASTSESLANQGKTPMYLAVDNQLAGLIAVADPVRKDSKAAIDRLHKLGIKVMMLTGDNKLTAAAVAQQVGIDDFQAEVMPEDKESYVRQLQEHGLKVGMTGDGINDAPALARADVGFAIGSGTDVAIESADITLIRSSLHGLADAVELSRTTLRNIKQNLFGALVYNSLGIPIAAGILYPLTGILLNPVVAGAAMALSSVTVVSNANRLRLFKPTAREA
ncbi:copper-transporting ATPase [Endozoicomonas numazuensis]|uniref:Copper-exporting P-type ATPase n=1 Tax=Endozoicomonas numazuensis TaxID=1137799 RepID=A0A081NJ93_9GAMM|nr:copper-transporting ATPase [Endozoicomonas numazuensis]